MSSDPPTTSPELAPERRAIGRRHTANLLKMLRGGYGTVPEPESVAEVRPVAELKPVRVADAAPAYVRLVETRPAASNLSGASSRPPIPAIGDGLRQHTGNLGQLVARADQWAETIRVFQAYLRPDLRDHAVLIRMDQEVWTVQTESAAWATRLRYALYDIRQVLGLHFGITLPKPQIQIAPAAVAPPAPTPRRTLPRQAADDLENIARHESDPRLSAALRRLARRAEPAP